MSGILALHKGTNRKERTMENTSVVVSKKKEKESNIMIVNIPTEVDILDLMDSVYNNLWRRHSPWIESIEYDWEDDNRADIPVTVICWNNNHGDYDNPENFLTKVLDKHDLLKAFVAVVSGEYYHCGYRITGNTDDWDTCCSDTIIQMALYGEVVFG